MLPKITIVTPSFNQGKYLERTVLSVLNQYYPNLEYIIIDGGSTDSSVEIIKKYGERLTYWISGQDQGQSDAINKGFKMATGDYIGWLNSDDELNENALNVLVKHITENVFKDKKKILYYGIVQLIDEESRHIKFEPFSETISFKKLLYSKAQCLQPGSFYSKNELEQVNFINEDLHFSMDVDLWLRLLRIGEAQFLPHIMAKTRIHPEAKSSSKRISDLKESYLLFKTHGGSCFSKKFLRHYYYFLRYNLTGRVTKKY